jgi:hypothetical protein
MSDQENVHIKIGLSGTYWDKKPQYRISVNDQVYADSTITAESGKVEYIEFDAEYSTETAVLKIEFLNKTPEDTKKDNYEDPVNFKIIDDMLLNIASVEIDEIDLAMIPFDHGEYHAEGQADVIKKCVNLGWNGAWTLTWTNPFYIWLLETL